ncbi:MAG: gliding motility-associated C-terminal domain-containing protein [Flavobacteriales bacterium]|nr:gliding motility-associated C-terminal domain-containing protein [Flavobacteriales bacterium]
MKIKISLITALFFLAVTFVQAQTTTAFRKNYNVAMFDLPGNIVEGLTPNTYVMAGTNMTFIPIYGTISQLNDTGGVTWSFRYSDASIGFQINDLKKDAANSQYYACGGSESNAAVFLVVDAAGNIVNSKRFKINEADGAWFNRVIKTADGGYVAVGYVTGYDPDGAGAEIDFAPINYTDANGDPQTEVIGSPLIVKMDASGNHVWHKVFRYYVTSNTPANRIYNDASFVDVVEVSDGYVAVGSYDVNNHLSATNSDGDDATPTDAIILKTNTSGTITYHKQIDTPSNNTSQSSKYYGAVNKTSVGDIIAGGSTDDGYELIQKFTGAGGFSNVFSRRFRYSTSMFGTVTDPADVSQIYELSGGDLATMTMYIKPLSFFSNAIHRVNSTATSNVWSKRYDFSLISILPRGGLVSDGGFISMAMTMGGANYDYHVIKTDPSGDTPLSGCPAATFAPTASGGPGTFVDPIYNSWSGTVGPDAIAVTKIAIAPTPSYVCTKTTCTPPLEATTVTATPATICSGQSTTITASGPSAGVSYQVWTAASGGTNLGTTPLVLSPASTTTYYIQTVNNSDPTCVSATRVSVTVTVNTVTTSVAGTNQSVCGTSATLAGNTPTAGTGVWTLVSGSGTITTPSNPNSGVTGLGVGANVFEWTISNAPCTPSSSQVTITGVAAPTASNAGTNQTLCSTSATLSGNTPSVGTGVWTLVSGSGTITTPGNPNSTVTGLGVGANVFEWTISNSPCASSSTQVTITNTGGPTTSVAGTNQTVCGTSATLAGNTPIVGTGVWTLVSGSGTITTPGNPNSTVTGLGVGANVFEWTISNAPCTSSSTQVTITNTGGPTTSVAGTNQTVCGTSATLAGNTPIVGTGVWTLVSGSGTITTPSNPNSGVTGLGVGANVFEWTISNAPCTPSSSQVTITGIAAPTASNAGTNQTLCSTSTTLAGNTPSVGTGVWTLVSGSGTITTPGNPNSTVTGLGVGANVFEWTISNAPCTSSSSQVTITVSGGPTVNANATDTAICMGENVTLTGSGNAVSYSWNNGVVDGVSFAPTVTQTYTVTGLDANSCSTQVQIQVVVNPLPSIIVTGNNSLCNGDSTTLTASGALGYVWSTSDTSTSIVVTPASTTTYTVSGINMYGCTDSTQYTVTVSAPPIAAINGNPSICFGQTVTLTASGGSTYTWSTGESTTSISSSPNDTITYWVVAHVGSCTDSAFYTVNVTPNPTVAITPSTDVTIIQGESIDLTASGGSSYTWTPSTGLSCTACPTTTASPEETTKYCVGTTVNGCVDTTCITVTVDIICGELFVPTAFSPNGDGVNDCLSVYNNCIDKLDFKIFTRWGEVVHQSVDVNDCWDGSFKGTALNTAVFVYKLEATLLNGEEIKLKGNVSLIK